MQTISIFIYKNPFPHKFHSLWIPHEMALNLNVDQDVFYHRSSIDWQIFYLIYKSILTEDRDFFKVLNSNYPEHSWRMRIAPRKFKKTQCACAVTIRNNSILNPKDSSLAVITIVWQYCSHTYAHTWVCDVGYSLWFCITESPRGKSLGSSFKIGELITWLIIVRMRHKLLINLNQRQCSWYE